MNADIPTDRRLRTVISRVYALARPFGRGKLLVVIGFAFLQAVFQVIGVTSIFPFLALAADRSAIEKSVYGKYVTQAFPELSHRELIVAAGVLSIVAIVLSCGVSLLSEFVRSFYAQQFAHWLRGRLLTNVISRPYGDFLRAHSGVSVKKIVNDVAALSEAVLLPLLDSLARIATLIFLFTIILVVQPVVAAVAMIVLGIYYVAIFKVLSRRRRSISDQLKSATRGTYVSAQQAVSGIKDIKITGTEGYFVDQFNMNSRLLARCHPLITMYSTAPRHVIECIAFGGIVLMVLLLVGRSQDLLGVLPGLGVMAFAGYRLLPAAQLLYGQFTQIGTSLHALDEVYEEFLAAEKEGEERRSGTELKFLQPNRLNWRHSIRLQDLSFAYPGALHQVVNRLNVVIPKNSAVAIVGPSGCGKSTLVDLLLGLHAPTRGRILIDETVLVPSNCRAWRSGIGYVPQEIFLIDDSIEANIAFGVPKAEIDQVRLRQSAAAAQILEFIETELGDGFMTMVGERGVRLSGGQRQRIGLARALYRQPDVLVLDEATSALDSETETEVMRAIKGLHGTITMIVIAHRIQTVQFCDARIDLGSLKNAPANLPPLPLHSV